MFAVAPPITSLNSDCATHQHDALPTSPGMLVSLSYAHNAAVHQSMPMNSAITKCIDSTELIQSLKSKPKEKISQCLEATDCDSKYLSTAPCSVSVQNNNDNTKNLQLIHSFSQAICNDSASEAAPAHYTYAQHNKDNDGHLRNIDQQPHKELQKFTVMKTPFVDNSSSNIYLPGVNNSFHKDITNTLRCVDQSKLMKPVIHDVSNSTSNETSAYLNNLSLIPANKYTKCRNQEQIQQSISSTTPKKRHRLEAEMKTIVSGRISSDSMFVSDGVSEMPEITNLTSSLKKQTVLLQQNDPSSQLSEPVLFINNEKMSQLLIEEKKPIEVTPTVTVKKTKYERSCKYKETSLPKDRVELSQHDNAIESTAQEASKSLPTTPTKTARAVDVVLEQRVLTRQQCKSPSVSPTSSPVKRRCESRTSTVSTRSHTDTTSKPGTPDLIADTDVSPDKIAQDIIITDGILESAKGRMDLLDCKVDLYQMNERILLNNATVSCPPNNISKEQESTCDGGTHSDSDIASEHEPLNESDQSGFMSDKEETVELVKQNVSPPQKRLKKKRELRPPAQKMSNTEKIVREIAEIEEEDKELLPPPSKKKIKKRKPNRTGFPTVKKKKKVSRQEIEEEELESSTNDAEKSKDDATKPADNCPEPVEDLSCTKNPIVESKKVDESTCQKADPLPVRLRGRPKKIKPEIEPECAQSDQNSRSCKLRDRKSHCKDVTEKLNTAECEPDSTSLAPLVSEIDKTNGIVPTNQLNDVTEENKCNNSIRDTSETKGNTPNVVEVAGPCIASGNSAPGDDVPDGVSAADGVSSRTRRKREIVLEELANPATKRKRRKLLHTPETVSVTWDSACGIVLSMKYIFVVHFE